MKLIQQLSGQDEEGENQDSNRDELKDASSAGKSKQVKQLLADLVSTKGDSGQTDGDPIEVTEEELVGGYILGTHETYFANTQSRSLRILHFTRPLCPANRRNEL